jgi:hypothetical protein
MQDYCAGLIYFVAGGDFDLESIVDIDAWR